MTKLTRDMLSGFFDGELDATESAQAMKALEADAAAARKPRTFFEVDAGLSEVLACSPELLGRFCNLLDCAALFAELRRGAEGWLEVPAAEQPS